MWEGASAERVFGAIASQRQILGAPLEFEMLDGRQALLLNRDGALFDLGGRSPTKLADGVRVDSMAVLGGALVAVCGDRLGYFEEGRFVERLALPSAGMRVAAGASHEIYLYGSHDGGSVIYLLKDWRIWPILRMPGRRIDSLAAVAERIFFSVEGSIYTFARGERAGLLFVATGESSIDSLAADPAAGLLYFSAGDKVFALRAGVAFAVLAGVRGILRHSGKALYVLDRDRLQLIKVSGLEAITRGDAAARAMPTMRRSGAADFKE